MICRNFDESSYILKNIQFELFVSKRRKIDFLNKKLTIYVIKQLKLKIARSRKVKATSNFFNTIHQTIIVKNLKSSQKIFEIVLKKETFKNENAATTSSEKSKLIFKHYNVKLQKKKLIKL